jgi:phosphonate transport system ATP-binding protein
VVGLELGAVVYDGPPDGLSPEVLTRIYGEEDWSATIKANEDKDNDDTAEEL